MTDLIGLLSLLGMIALVWIWSASRWMARVRSTYEPIPDEPTKMPPGEPAAK